MMLKYLTQTSIFRYSKNYGSLTHETRIKDAVNMGDLICLLATVRTLKYKYLSTFKGKGSARLYKVDFSLHTSQRVLHKRGSYHFLWNTVERS